MKAPFILILPSRPILGTIINAINLSSLLILAIIGAQWAHCTTHLNSCVEVQMDLYLGKEGVADIAMALGKFWYKYHQT